MRWTVASATLVVATLTLAGCGGGSTPAAKPTPSDTPSVSATPAAPSSSPTPEAVEPSGEPAPEALSSFRCELGKKKQWVAAGFLSNSEKKAATYQVSVYVGPLDGEFRSVRTKRVENVAPGGSVRFEITKIPAAGDQCHVQVLRTK